MHLFTVKQCLLSVVLGLSVLLLTSCETVTFVQPYDEKLISGTEEIYKKAGKIIEAAKLVSPTERPREAVPPNTPGHYDQFKSKYSDLVVDANSLVLRSVVNSSQISALGITLQSKIEIFVSETIPSLCSGSAANFGIDNPSLTVQNMLDLKCLISNWDKQHQDPRTFKVLTSSDWSNRHVSLMRMIVEIQKAETFKKSN
jgi:hypothetical protein